MSFIGSRLPAKRSGHRARSAARSGRQSGCRCPSRSGAADGSWSSRSQHLLRSRDARVPYIKSAARSRPIPRSTRVKELRGRHPCPTRSLCRSPIGPSPVTKRKKSRCLLNVHGQCVILPSGTRLDLTRIPLDVASADSSMKLSATSSPSSPSRPSSKYGKNLFEALAASPARDHHRHGRQVCTCITGLYKCGSNDASPRRDPRAQRSHSVT